MNKILRKIAISLCIACVASVSVRFRSKEKWHFHFLALVSFLARPKPRILFLGLSLLRNQTETLATPATLCKTGCLIYIEQHDIESI